MAFFIFGVKAMLKAFKIFSILNLLAVGLTACVSISDEHAYLIKARVEPTSVKAEADNYYSYRFAKDNTPETIKKFQSFTSQFQPYLVGGYIVIEEEVDDFKPVVASYYLVLDEDKLSDEQKAQLLNEFQATPYLNTQKKKQQKPKQLQVVFKATGSKSYMGTVALESRLTEQDRLAKPIPVRIVTNGKELHPVAEIMLVPIYPLLMMYGCLTGPCV